MLKIFQIICLGFLIFSPEVQAATRSITDNEIMAQIEHAFASEKSLAKLRLKPMVSWGHVKLKGAVKLADEAVLAIHLTEAIDGVLSIDTRQLKVNNKPITLHDDTYIRSKLTRLYNQENLLGPFEVNSLGLQVESQDGAVILHGEIHEAHIKMNPEQYRQRVEMALNMAKQLPGVKSACSQLILIMEEPSCGGSVQLD